MTVDIAYAVLAALGSTAFLVALVTALLRTRGHPGFGMRLAAVIVVLVFAVGINAYAYQAANHP